MASFEARRQENIQENALYQAHLQIAAAGLSSSSLKSEVQSSSRRKRSFDVYRGRNQPRHARYGGSYAETGNCASGRDPDEGNDVDSHYDADEDHDPSDYDDADEDHDPVDDDDFQWSKNDGLARAAAAGGKHLALNTSAESDSQTRTQASLRIQAYRDSIHTFFLHHGNIVPRSFLNEPRRHDLPKGSNSLNHDEGDQSDFQHFNLPAFPATSTAPTRDWQCDLIAFDNGTHPDFSGFTPAQIGNILRFVHQKCEQIDLLAQAARSKQWTYSICSRMRHFIVVHTEPQALVSFKCRILACYSPQVKEFLGRRTWDYDEFLTLDDAIPVIAGTYWIMSSFQTSYIGSARSPRRPDVAGEGGLKRRIVEHKRVLQQDLEAILRGYSARHESPPAIIPGLGAARDALYCHVMLKQDTDRFKERHMEGDPGQRPGREALGFRVLTHAFEITDGAGQNTGDAMFLLIMESLDILFTRSLQAADNHHQSPECFELQGNFQKSYVAPTNRALPWSSFHHLLWTAKHTEIVMQVRERMVEHFGTDVSWHLPYHIIFSRFEAEGLVVPHRRLTSGRWRELFPDDGRRLVRVKGPDLTLNIVDFICEHGPVYAALHFPEFKAKHGQGKSCYSEATYRLETTKLSTILYDNLVEPLSFFTTADRPWSTKLRDHVVRRVHEQWGDSILVIVERLRKEFQERPSACALGHRAFSIESELNQEAFWGSVTENASRLDIRASCSTLTRFVRSYHARNPIKTREDAVRFLEAFPEFTPDQRDAPAALLAFVEGMNQPVTQDEAGDDTAPCFTDHLFPTQEPGLRSLFDDTSGDEDWTDEEHVHESAKDVLSDLDTAAQTPSSPYEPEGGESSEYWTANEEEGDEGADDIESDLDTHIVAEANAQTPFSAREPDGGVSTEYMMLVADNLERLKHRLRTSRYGIMLYGLCGEQIGRPRAHEEADAIKGWTYAENDALWTLLVNTKERTDWSTTYIDPLSFRGPDLGLHHVRAWWYAPTDNSVCDYPGLGRFTWAQVRDHAPQLGFGLQMNEDGFGVCPLPTSEELDIMEGLSTNLQTVYVQNKNGSSTIEYKPKDRPTRADLCDYPGLTRFNWGQIRLIANITCGIKIQLFQPTGDRVVGRVWVFRWNTPELRVLRRLIIRDSKLLEQHRQPPKSQEKCDYPGLETFNWRVVCVRAMELAESDLGADLPLSVGGGTEPGNYWSRFYHDDSRGDIRPKRGSRWSPEEFTALETYISNHPDRFRALGAQLFKPCQIPGLEKRNWKQVEHQVSRRGLMPAAKKKKSLQNK